MKELRNLTPMMQQYFEIKNQHLDCILFFRMGDFYEMFFEDALKASSILGIALTKRGKSEDGDIPMCGLPHHAAENYLVKLINNGCKVAICDQLESPEEAKKRGHKAVVKREVVRIVTPGTVLEDALLCEKKANYLMAISKRQEIVAISYVDASTGQIFVTEIKIESLPAELARINPAEILLAEKLCLAPELQILLQEYKSKVTQMVDSYFEFAKVLNRLLTYYNVATIEAFGDFSKLEIEAMGALVEYLSLTQKNNIPRIARPQRLHSKSFMTIDASTRRNLELTEASNEKLGCSVLDVIDLTKTSAGARLLRSYLSTPLVDPKLIDKRLDLVEFFSREPELTKSLRHLMSKISDTSRTLTKLLLYKAGPRELLAVKNDLEIFISIKQELVVHPVLAHFTSSFDSFESLPSLIENAIIYEPPFSIKDGGFVRKGFHSQLDELMDIDNTSSQKIESLRNQYINKTGINNLKINSNNMLGYYIEVTSSQLSKIDQGYFILRQSMVNCSRFTTPELQIIEQQINESSTHMIEIEQSIFFGIVEAISNQYEDIEKIIHRCSFIDFACSGAMLAIQHNYIRPTFSEDNSLLIEEGRHPVVEHICRNNRTEFVPNDIYLDDDQKLIILTGPNMGGKSTYLRQIAITCIMAQAGFFVPAKRAKIGIIDRVFSRVGAADDLATGKSTFMVEMVETATILNQATARSLVILDEIGRGTSTNDGLAIAKSVVEYIHGNIGSRTIFATHYHELVPLAEELTCVINKTVQVKEWNGKIIFLHKITDGAADKSYGLNVASLAGLPKSVIKRATEILNSIQRPSLHSGLPPISAKPSIPEDIKDLLAVNLDDISPRQAHELLAKIKALLK